MSTETFTYYPPRVGRIPGLFPRYQVLVINAQTGFGYGDVVWGRCAAERRADELAELIRIES